MSDPGRFDPEAVRQRVASDLRALAVPFNDNLPLTDAVPSHPPKEDEAAARRMVILYALTGLAHEAKAERLWQWILTSEIAHEVTAAERDYFLKAPL